MHKNVFKRTLLIKEKKIVLSFNISSFITYLLENGH